MPTAAMQTFSFEEIDAVERVLDMACTHERVKAGVELLSSTVRPSEMLDMYDQFR